MTMMMNQIIRRCNNEGHYGDNDDKEDKDDKCCGIDNADDDNVLQSQHTLLPAFTECVAFVCKFPFLPDSPSSFW